MLTNNAPVTQQGVNYNYLSKDSKIWVENETPKTYSDTKEEPFFLAVVIKCDDVKKEVEVRYISSSRPIELVKYEKTMPFLNDSSINVNDMAAVEDINEVDLLNNLKNRFYNKGIFTNVGPTLIVTNPYQKIDKIMGEDIIDEFLKYNQRINVDERKNIENPHLYDLTLIAIKHLKENRKNQAIVISGESGAGKTESAKNAMTCITYYFGKGDSVGINYTNTTDTNTNIKNEKTSLENQILGCNPILEAFGNAKTVRNDNSSRFGKYVTINLDLDSGKIEGAQIDTYLLEKSRIIEPAEGERNYHIFYHLLKGASNELLTKLHLTSNPRDYNILSSSRCFEVETINDVTLFNEMLESFKITGFSENEIQTILNIIAACLLLGNLTFTSVNDCATVVDKSLLESISQLLQCDPKTLETVLTVNIRVIINEVVQSPLKVSDSYIFRNNFAKELYNRAFNWIVKKLNKQLSPNLKNETSSFYIGLLDIFGFECFNSNSLEQFCINFTNEKLQQLYINDVFKAEQNEFIKEGLKEHLNQIIFKDNKNVIDLMDTSSNGIFQLLDDKCITNNDDKSFFEAIKKYHQGNSSLKVNKLSLNKFSINHTAKEVEYTTNGFVLKNLDEVKQSMIDAMLDSKDSTIKYIFMNAVDEKDYQLILMNSEVERNNNRNIKKDSKYLGGKFRSDMVKLMNELSACECHYVRCLKPNEFKKKECFIPTFVFKQIKYLGILDTIRIRKEGYPSRKIFKDFFFRFEDVSWFEGKKPAFEYHKVTEEQKFKELALLCLDYIIPNWTVKECLIGTTKIFMKHSFYSKLEKIRSEKIKKKEDAVTMISKTWKGHKVYKQISNVRSKAKYLQEFWTNKKHYVKTQKMRAATKKIQSTYRALLINRTYKYMLVCIYKLQNTIKSFLIRQHVKRIKLMVVFLVKRMRIFLLRARQDRKRKIQYIVEGLFERSWEFILKKYKFFAAIKIQSHVRKYLIKIKNWVTVLKGRSKREDFLKNKSSLIIQKNFKGYSIRKNIRIKNAAIFKIQGFWKSSKYMRLIREMRLRVLIIQRNVSIYFIRKHVIDKRLGEYFREENHIIDKLRFDSSKILFPNSVNINHEEEKGFFEDVVYQDTSDIPKIEYRGTLPELDPYSDTKITCFAKILDMDFIIDSTEMYDQLWAKEFEIVFNSNIANKTPIQLIHTGSCHTMTVNSKGKVFSWGSNAYGQCGQSTTTSKPNIKVPEITRDRNRNIPPIPFADYLSSGKSVNIEDFGVLKQVVCGDDHSLLLDENGNVYACGSNSNGQLGAGHCSYIDKPKLISELKGRVREINSSGDISLAITTDNELYVWPFENFTQNYKPLRLFLDKKITIQTLSCGKNFAMILSKQGILYSFGMSNRNGELGLGDTASRLGPEPILALANSGEKITQVSCGFKHTIAKSPNGKVFTWGNNSDGQLGIGGYLNMDTPAIVSFNNLYAHRIKISQVSAGFRSSFFLNDARQILCTGTSGSNTRADLPVKFEIKNKTPEISDDNSFAVMRIMNTWNKGFSIFYCTLADIRIFAKKINNKSKVNVIVNTLVSKWENESFDAPYIETISGYFYPSFMKKPKELEKSKIKSK